MRKTHTHTKDTEKTLQIKLNRVEVKKKKRIKFNDNLVTSLLLGEIELFRKDN